MADSIHVLGEGGSVFKMDLPLPEPIAQWLAKGELRRVNSDGSSYQEPVPEESVPEEPVPGDGSALTEGRTPRPKRNGSPTPSAHWGSPRATLRA
jgi:hypothetical protein